MDYSLVLKNISKHITLDDGETAYFTSLLKYKEVRKKDILLKEGQTCRYINYVHSGALRAYHLDMEGNESVIMFAINDWWVTDMCSFTTLQPAMLNIDALEDSTIFELDKNDLDKLYIKVPKFERFFRIIMQNSYVREQLRVIQNLSISAEQKYINFIAKYPQFVQRVSQKQIASYLGMTPEFLSTIRKKISSG